MLYFSLIDILFVFVGVVIGVILSSICTMSGYRSKCDDCVYREVLKDGKENIMGIPERKEL